MSTTRRNAFVQTFANAVDDFVKYCRWQVIPDLLQCIFCVPCKGERPNMQPGCDVCPSVCLSAIGKRGMREQRAYRPRGTAAAVQPLTTPPDVTSYY